MKLRDKHLLCAAGLAAILLLIIAAAWTEQSQGVAVKTAPVLAGLSPDTITAGSPGFTLTARGTFFASGAIVQWNGAARATSVVDGEAARAQIPASDVASGGTADVTVVNPGFPNERSGVSNVLVFRVVPASSF